jgi:hypothetical protein
VPGAAASLVIAIVWVLILAALLRYGLWVAIVAALVLALMSLSRVDVPNSVDREYEWRRGLLGFGLYDAEGFRVDPHDPQKRD